MGVQTLDDGAVRNAGRQDLRRLFRRGRRASDTLRRSRPKIAVSAKAESRLDDLPETPNVAGALRAYVVRSSPDNRVWPAS